MSVFKMLKAACYFAPRVTPAECAARVRSGEALLVDVREPHEWSSGVADSAALLPMSDLNGARTLWREFLAKVGQREVLTYCAVGARSGIVARILVSEGVRAANAGSLSEWRTAGWPIVPPPGAERTKPAAS
jgi:rhodanese-related sulfurtransferase